MSPRLSIVLLGMATACGAPADPCASAAAGPDRDWCLVGRAVDEADADAIDAAVATLESIEDPAIRSAGVRRVLPRARTVPLEKVEDLCDGLGAGLADECRRAWARAHLWETEPDPARP